MWGELYNKKNKRIVIGYNLQRWLFGGEVNCNNSWLFFFGPFFICYQKYNKKHRLKEETQQQ